MQSNNRIDKYECTESSFMHIIRIIIKIKN